nr:apolipoprotein N-acyltransferase [Pseudomonadota bacterium]
VYGLSLLTLITAGIIYEMIARNRRRLHFLVLMIAVIWINGALLSHTEFSHANGKKLKVAMIQGNVPQEYKWQPEKTDTIIDTYNQLTQAHWNADLILWPEAAIPMLKDEAAPFLQHLEQQAKKQQKTVLIGIPFKEDNLYYNGLILLGQSQGQYAKRHLIPFGEYTPFTTWLDPLMLALSIPMSSFSSGAANQPPLVVNNIHFAPFICYEIVEPDEVRRSLQNAEMIITISDDSWFDGSIASEQHLQMARMRSLENAMPQLFLSSRGASAIIAADGKILATLGEHQRGVLTHTVSTVVGITPWRRFGSQPTLLYCFLGLIASIIYSNFSHRKIE